MTAKSDWMNGLIWVIAGVLLDFGIQIFGVSGSQSLARLFGQPVNGPLATCFLVLIVGILTFFVARVLIGVVKQQSPNLGLHPIEWHKLVYVFSGYFAIIFGLMFINMARILITGQMTVASNQQTLQNTFSQGPYGIVFVGVLAIIVAPIVEELIFRGLVMNYFFKNSGWWWNIALSAVLFGYFHVYSAFNVFDFMQYAVMGAILAYIYKKTHQLQYAMLTHAFNNAISFFAMMSMI